MSEACQAGIEGPWTRALQHEARRGLYGLPCSRWPEGSLDRNRLTERFGITTVGGQEKLKGTIIRIGHMGYTDELDVISTLAAMEMTLAELGFDVEPGRAVTAAQQVLIGRKPRSQSAERGHNDQPPARGASVEGVRTPRLTCRCPRCVSSE